MEEDILDTDTLHQEGDEDTETPQESVEDLRAQLEAEKQAKEDYAKKFEDQKRRAEKAEGKVKSIPKDDTAKPSLTTNNVSMDEVFLVATERITLEELNYAKKVAQLEEIPLEKAIKSDLFTAWKEKRERDTRAQEAAMRSSKGGSQTQEQKTFTTPGLSDEEHKKLFMQRRK